MSEDRVHRYGVSDLVAASNLTRYLKSWRAARGQELGLNGPLPQAKVQIASGKSDKWYRMFEAGLPVKYEADVLQRIADCLGLDHAERMTLFLMTMGVPSPIGVTSNRDDPELLPISWVLDQQGRRPAYVSDEDWGIVAFNEAMGKWFPWVAEPNANLMRWTLLHPDARVQLESWEKHCRVYLGMIRMEIARRGTDSAIARILLAALEDPLISGFWEEETTVVSNRDGHHFRVRVPYNDNKPTDVISQVCTPAKFPGLRLVFLTWGDGMDDFEILGTTEGQ
ncbi:XRE family transcriptional regulator [Streptomyces noursei]|uniref:MmyB family transcriptional regulator n=1 Tax=Streptomyces noursei TaxID=1971 RepID=UPI0016745C92|nr:XRE family transcriptional regulator [Streptomyces noursei]MCZ1019419.1 XRE family transcriptional regulator [Streptomyces noursei]GGX08273.1 transcriptional regulator [Streptomyces noursei]